MRRCRSVYLCFIGAVFLLSLYNFVSLTMLTNPHKFVHGCEKGTDCQPLDLSSKPSVELPEKAKNSGNVVEDNDLIVVGEQNQLELSFEEDNHHIFQIGDSQEDLEELEVAQPPNPEPAIFFPANVELAMPDAGQKVSSCAEFRKKVERTPIRKTVPPGWTTCGRPTNAYAELEDGAPLCVRHRHPHDYLVAGDILSYHMAEQLGIQSVPCVIATEVLPSSKWRGNITELGWADNQTVALIQWVPGQLQRVPLPPILLDGLMKGSTVFWKNVSTWSTAELTDLAQWTDLIIFDYLIGHYDRIASLQDEADKQQSKSLLKDHIRNMARDTSGTLWFFDNEAGLLDGYILMYEEAISKNHLRFQRFHEEVLKTVCVFRRNTVHAINTLYQRQNPLEEFLEKAYANEPLLKKFNIERGTRYKYLKEHFTERISHLISYIKECSEKSFSHTDGNSQ